MDYTLNSHICSLIHQHPDDWEKIIEEKGIKVKREEELAIFNYNITCDFSDPIVAEARGIIINVDTQKVVCWPFTKFGNWGESYVKDVDWNTARIQEKLDGSIVKLWYDERMFSWRWSTNSMIDANDAKCSYNGIFASYKTTFMELILHTIQTEKALEGHHLNYDTLDKNETYIFELCTRENQVVIQYQNYKLWHIGTRNNVTGKERVCDIGFDHPKEYPLKNLDECLKYLKTFNSADNSIEHEGFVVVDGNFNRLKLKTEEYILLHHSMGGKKLSIKNVLNVIHSDDQLTYENVLRQYPENAHIFKYYEWQIYELQHKIDAIAIKALALFEEYDRERKAVANILIKEDKKFSRFGFMALDGKDVSNIVRDMTDIELMKYLDLYVEHKK